MNAKQLRRAQHALGMTTTELAKALGMSERSLYYRLSGEKSLKPLEVAEIQRLLKAKEREGRATP